MFHRYIWSVTTILLGTCTAFGFPNPSADCTSVPLVNATVDQLQQGLRQKCFNSVDLVTAHLSRIYEVNSTLHTVLEINPDVYGIAMRMDMERRIGHTRGPLHGIPVLIKDIIGTKDKMQTAMGSYALVGAQVPADATVVTKLREQGMIIMGKTSMSEWANVRSSNSSNGWNARGGQTYGAYHPQQDPSGSSSGSAVSTDLGLAAVTLGSETSGSILLPSSLNNVVGIKPTVGLTSRYMVVPISERADTIGPIGRTVTDAALMLQAIAGPDPKDNYTMASPFGEHLPDYAAACNLAGLQGKRIGIPRNVLDAMDPTNEAIRTAFNNAVATLEEAGATVIDNANFTAYTNFTQSMSPSIVIAADFISGLSTYLTQLTRNPNNLHGLSSLRDFVHSHPALEDYPSRDTNTWDMALGAGIDNHSPEFWALYQESLFFGDEGGILGALARDNLDAVILPTIIAPEIPALVGTPAISVPLGAFPDGTPVQYNPRGDLVAAAPGVPFGISFLGAKWSEQALIGMAYAFEQRTLVRGSLERYVEPRTEVRMGRWGFSS
ncbi:amidase [Aspergillus campestris IBT 28561]|uniref:Amidase n=1 Tax=Aspergillus campestris (strain IBT 28561) TaxID=1392248 RepID=A0A2I1D826_ASPC2|nr:amidase [Aspergillus campestris IBT 28561]PKY06036.1 amidase [Aspergillus campestris IBT 28561]